MEDEKIKNAFIAILQEFEKLSVRLNEQDKVILSMQDAIDKMDDDIDFLSRSQ